MGVACVRPSRVISEVTLNNTLLPNGSGATITWKATGLPARGIIHRFSMRMVYASPITQHDEYDAIWVHTNGIEGANAGTIEFARTVEAQYCLDLNSILLSGSHEAFDAGAASVYMPTLRLASPMTMAALGTPAAPFLDGASNAPAVNQGYNVGAETGFYYDVSGTVKGPNDNTGELYFTWISDATNYRTQVDQITCRLEIEPCF